MYQLTTKDAGGDKLTHGCYGAVPPSDGGAEGHGPRALPVAIGIFKKSFRTTDM